MKPCLPAFALLSAFSGAACAQQLSPAEERIVAEVKARTPAALALLERSVNINSGTMNHAGVREVGKLFRAELDQLGFKTRWIDMPAAMQRAGHLVGTREGRQGKRVLLLGHLDTVFEPDSPVQKWQRKGDRVSGQGVSDMKGGNVVVIEALRALHKVGALDNTNIAVMFTGDEENAGDPKDVSRGDMVALAKKQRRRAGLRRHRAGQGRPRHRHRRAPLVVRLRARSAAASRATRRASSASAPATARCMKRRASSTASASR